MHLKLAVVRDDAVERVERDIQREDPVEDADAVHVVIEISARLGVIHLVEVPLPRVPEGGVPDVVPEGDRLDEVEVQPEDGADRARDAGDELYVQSTAGDVVVFIE